MTTPAAGDHLVSSRGAYAHHGLYVGDGQVIHYAGLSNGWQRGKVEQVALAEFEAKQGWRIRKHKRRPFTREASVARARGRVGEDHYCALANNCEHFVHWCISGDHASFQVGAGAHLSNVTVTGIGGVAVVFLVGELGAVAGLSASGIMSGLATVGGFVGSGAVAGLGIVSVLPGAASVLVLNHTLLRDNPGLGATERSARRVGRVATGVGAAGGTVGGLAAVGAMGTVAGFSGAGITSGLAAIGSATGAGAALSAMGVGGGMMVGGVVVTVAAPALLAATVGYGAYRGVKWLRGAGWLGRGGVRPPALSMSVRITWQSGQAKPSPPSLPGPPPVP